MFLIKKDVFETAIKKYKKIYHAIYFFNPSIDSYCVFTPFNIIADFYSYSDLNIFSEEEKIEIANSRTDIINNVFQILTCDNLNDDNAYGKKTKEVITSRLKFLLKMKLNSDCHSGNPFSNLDITWDFIKITDLTFMDMSLILFDEEITQYSKDHKNEDYLHSIISDFYYSFYSKITTNIQSFNKSLLDKYSKEEAKKILNNINTIYSFTSYSYSSSSTFLQFLNIVNPPLCYVQVELYPLPSAILLFYHKNI